MTKEELAKEIREWVPSAEELAEATEILVKAGRDVPPSCTALDAARLIKLARLRVS